ncbi:hypothetical protein MAPG_12057 [Magnaporthiopsis poae ATCC 64411]|uniref:Uncharacterized protein n=1 Tax=Magnaporthiopsis poae (strain ATCC 64411 / 73-15) TaxID=644358 RepID=A0A0C4EGR4_MAGP6|nr:hypothetical protein MAPG_12057 [Magnaporthiopsis poae ATCC 64411]
MGTATAYFPPHTVSRIGTIDLPQSRRRLRWRPTSPLGMVDEDDGGNDDPIAAAADEPDDGTAAAAVATTTTPRPINSHQSAFKLVSVDERTANGSPVVARFDRVGDVGCARMEGQLRVYSVEDYELEVGGREVLDVLMLLSLSSVVRPLSLLRRGEVTDKEDGGEMSSASRAFLY